jgi:hypothetical protein
LITPNTTEMLCVISILQGYKQLKWAYSPTVLQSFLQYLTHAELSVADYVEIQNDANFIYIVTFYRCA